MNQNIVPKAVSAVIDAPATSNATIQTTRGTWRFRIGDLKDGRTLVFEDGDVMVQAVPAPARISQPSQTADRDYPTLATAADSSAWAAWQVYENGGDRVLAAHSTASGWSAAEPLTPAGQDVFHTAIAEDARGRVWVVWSRREGEAWDLIARNSDGRTNNSAGTWSAPRKRGMLMVPPITSFSTFARATGRAGNG